MKLRNGTGFKRTIKFDDDCMGLYMDFKLPMEDRWHSVTPEIAREAAEDEKMKRAESLRRVIQANGQQTMNNLYNKVRPASEGSQPAENVPVVNLSPPGTGRSQS